MSMLGFWKDEDCSDYLNSLYQEWHENHSEIIAYKIENLKCKKCKKKFMEHFFPISGTLGFERYPAILMCMTGYCKKTGSQKFNELKSESGRENKNED